MNATPTDLRSTLEKILQWSCFKATRTCRGSSFVREAEANGAFWALWKQGEQQKQAIRDLGISVKRNSDGSYTINWYTDNGGTRPVAQAPVTTPVAAPAVVIRPPTLGETFTMPEAKPGCSWSIEQQNIFTWFATCRLPDGTTSRCLVVRARAGTGKTTTIKVAFSVAPEERALYCVFNKKNQREASQAIFDPRVEIKTLHSVGLMFIMAVWPNSRPTDEVELHRVEKVVGAQSPKDVKIEVKKLVAFAKNVFVGIPSLDDMRDLAEERDIECPKFEAEENGGYTRERLAQLAINVLSLSMERDPMGRISFNDMVWLPVAMGWVRAWYDLVVVDECQDMNLPQLTMAKAACKPAGRICVVGDDRQAIYHFRGAASDGIDMMKTTLKAAELGLTITYRCPKQVVKLAAALVPDYRAADSAPEGIVQALEAATIRQTVKIGDAILSRSNAPLMPLCLALLRKGVPARVEGRDIGKALKDIVDKLSAHSVPNFIQKLETWRERQLHRFEDTKNFEEKAQQIDDQTDTLLAIAEGASSVGEIARRLETLFVNSDDENAKPAVVLSSTHKAKGLEWEKVYLLRDTFNRTRPASAPKLSPAAEAARAKEEANIYYVALTRAKAHLVLASGNA